MGKGRVEDKTSAGQDSLGCEMDPPTQTLLLFLFSQNHCAVASSRLFQEVRPFSSENVIDKLTLKALTSHPTAAESPRWAMDLLREGSYGGHGRSHSAGDGIPRRSRGGVWGQRWVLRSSKDSPSPQHQSGKWWSGVEHLGALLLVNAKTVGPPASLELQLRASTPGAQRRWH